jgi:hypothetical protein
MVSGGRNLRPGGPNEKNDQHGYPLVNIQKAIENGHL